MSDKQIYKYPLDVGRHPIEVALPEGAEVLTVQCQRDTICLWALVDPARPTEKRYFEVFATGESVYCGMGVERRYISTAQMVAGSLIWHVFERLS